MISNSNFLRGFFNFSKVMFLSEIAIDLIFTDGRTVKKPGEIFFGADFSFHNNLMVISSKKTPFNKVTNPSHSVSEVWGGENLRQGWTSVFGQPFHKISLSIHY